MTFNSKSIIIDGHVYDRKHIEKIISDSCKKSVRHIVIDCFAGLGGVTAGFYAAPGWKVIICLNHWDKAIATHRANYPDCLHLEEDFKTADLEIIKYIVNEIRKFNPSIQVHLWCSFECTNFSGAKGGMSRDADSRTLAEDADRYIIAINPDCMWVENVREFELWGPMIPKVMSYHYSKKWNNIKNKVIVPAGMDEVEYYNILIENGHKVFCPLAKLKDKETKKVEWCKWMVPDPYLKGRDYQAWKKSICDFGYDVQTRLLNCADYAVPQHRIRLIMKFVRKGMPITWPKPTHSKTGKGGLPKWLPVGDCLNLEKEGESIVSFKKDKKGNLKLDKKGNPIPRISSPKTIERAMKGCTRHALNGAPQWIMKPNSSHNNTDVNAGSGIDKSSPAITCFNGMNVATARVIDNYFGNGFVKPITDPANVIGTKEGSSLHTIKFLEQNVSTSQFLGTYHSQGDGSKANNPSPGLTGKDKYPLITTHYIDHQFSDGQQSKSISEPSGGLQTVPKQKVIEVSQFVMGTAYNKGDDRSISLTETSHALTANRKHYYVLTTHWFEGGSKSISSPADCLVGSMNKAPTYLIVTEMGELAIEVYDYDPPHYKTMKKFMAENKIISINMRMLDEPELLKIMTLDDHKLIASSTDNKKMIGNAVPKKMVYHLALDHDKGTKNKTVNYSLF